MFYRKFGKSSQSLKLQRPSVGTDGHYTTSEIVYSYDPGVTTGYAVFKINHTRKTVTLLRQGEFKNYYDMLENHFAKIRTYAHAHTYVIYEDFHARAHNVILTSVEVFSIIKYFAYKDRLYCKRQQPHERKSAFSWFPEIDKLSNHARDATAHGLVFIYGTLLKNMSYKFIITNYTNT